MKTTLYQAIINILNEHFENKVEIITRQELITQLRIKYDFFERQPCWSNWERPVGATLYSLTSMDSIRNMLEKLDFLGKVYYPNTNKIKQGLFYIKQHIPDNLNYNKIRKMYNSLNQEIKDYYIKNQKQPNDLALYNLRLNVFKQLLWN